jgi:LPXTG-site transpeptidase (sortase) family protein
MSTAVTVAEDTAEDVPSPHRAEEPSYLAPGSGASAGQPAAVPPVVRPSGGAGAAGELGPARHLFGVALVVLATAALSLAFHLTLISGLQHRSAQQQAFDKLRKSMAQGTAPVGQTDSSGRLLDLGTPIFVLDIPSIHLHEVVFEGTTAGVLMSGPGHRRDSPMPGQAGSSFIMGREAAYGGPFRDLHNLKIGARMVITTGQGASTFKVIAKRHKGDPRPPGVGVGKGRLTLMTARGAAFVPSGILYVDADLTTTTQDTPPRVISTNQLPRAELPLATDTGTLWALVLWLQALVVISVGIVWSWTRWGRHQTWIVFLPVTALVGFFVADQFARLLPNLM